MNPKNIQERTIRHALRHPIIRENVCIYCLTALDPQARLSNGSTHQCAEQLQARQPATPTPYN